MAHRGQGRHGSGDKPWGAGPWGSFGLGSSPPPWVSGLFGGSTPQRPRGPQVRRGDVRVAIIDVLAAAEREEEPINGYQVIGRIDERSHGAWRPSPGSVYPTIQQLQDEGLVEADEDRGRRTVRLSTAGVIYAEEHADELAAVWAPFESGSTDSPTEGVSYADLKPEIGQMMSAVWQIVTSGSDSQRRAAIEILIETRRKLYGVLADGHDGHDGPDPAPDAVEGRDD